MTRQFKYQNGLNYVVEDGTDIDYIRYDNKDNILIVFKRGHGVRGKLIRDKTPWEFDYAFEYLKPEELEADRKVVSQERREFEPGTYKHK